MVMVHESGVKRYSYDFIRFLYDRDDTPRHRLLYSIGQYTSSGLEKCYVLSLQNDREKTILRTEGSEMN